MSVEIAADGSVLGATDAHWEDLDSFFAIAEERQVYVMATLMSFDHFEDGAEARWKAWIESDQNIDSYLENYLIPFLEPHGWQGTMPWTSNGVDRNGGFAEVSAAAASFRDARPWLVFPSCP